MLNHTSRFFIDKVIEGSTLIGDLDLGFGVKIRKKIRLVNVKCHNTQVDKGKHAKAFVEGLIKDKPVYCKTFKDRFGKWANVLAIVFVQTDEDNYINLNNVLIEKGLAVNIKGNSNGNSNNTNME